MSNTVGKWFENKQVVHVATEVVVLLGLVFYFSAKNKRLMNNIEELAHRLEEQESKIQKLETDTQNQLQQIIKNMASIPIKEIAERFEIYDRRISICEANFVPNSVPNPLSNSVHNSIPAHTQRKLPKKHTKPLFSTNNVTLPLESTPDVIPKVNTELGTNKKVQFKTPPVETDSDKEELDSDSELDDAIRQELTELNELQNDNLQNENESEKKET